MTLKKVIQEYKKDNEITYKVMAERSELNNRMLEEYGCGSKKRINYKTAKKLSENLGIEFQKIEEFIS